MFGLHLEPGLARVFAEMTIPDTGPERNRLAAHYRDHILNRTQKNTAGDIPELRQLLSPHLTGGELVGDFWATALVGPNLAVRAFPNIFSQVDKDGLVPINNLRVLHSGLYQIGPLILFAHPFFRRRLSRFNALNADVLHVLQDLRNNRNCRVRLRLDPDAVGLATSAKEAMEFEYWYGPKFNDDLSTITPGLTVHSATEFQTLMHQITRTEFWWQSRFNNDKDCTEHILEAEELRDRESYAESGPEYGCRYVHSIVNDKTQLIEHLDGAIRGYDAESMLSRLENNLKTAGRHTAYTKLWRVDGQIPLNTWKGLVHHHFRDNSLIGEYLGGPPAQDPWVSGTTTNREPGSVLEYIPYSIRSNDGLRLALSYHSPQQVPEGERTICPTRFVTIKEQEIPWFDIDFLEVKKALGRVGVALKFPEPVRLLVLEDRYHEFPIIVHRSKDAADATLAAYKTLFSEWRKKQADVVFAFGIGVIEEDQIVTVSVLGHMDDLVEWLGHVTFPNRAERSQWLERNGTLINRSPAAHDRPALRETLTAEGIFEIRRHPLPLIRSGKTKVIDESRLHEEERRILEKEELEVALAYDVRLVTCSKCKGDYTLCPCSKVLDPGVIVEVTATALAYLFLTDRKVEWTGVAGPDGSFGLQARQF
jgi:hypothetical protein